MSETAILHDVADGVMRITLNRPDVLNAFDMAMGRQLQSVLDLAAADRAVRAVLVTGAGRAFCAGQDLGAVSLDAPAGPPDLGNVVRELWNPIIRRIRQLGKPVVAAVNGVAAGAGANVALACDLVLASRTASFIQAFSKLGIIPDSGGTFFLPRLVGTARATALMFLAEKVPAEQAAAWGMIWRVCEPEALVPEAEALARQLATLPTRGFALTKQAINASMTNDVVAQLDEEERLQREAGHTHDFVEGVRAFLEKRTPEFRGE
ncbi:MAG TPA: 2-(1,2-epoxy-1,2-dihydrophenyl)acetyl-CoA isomerase PaaG [Gemmatimonadaceae bacterium]|nr:MAG: 2-(1,2-epoxy-1,2-dihydrophenyl)acetyl-CoA isomerase [Gemmatimonadetes bacterium SCN 70-22]HMN07774.1 2-(1,2-epoxy-1,2-dihydrophenyl)acetyl-CoA isomerase PaaG [Gemmatimonadaceae bacterium]